MGNGAHTGRRASTTIAFAQPIAASEPLRTGVYVKTLTFTLSPTAP